MLKEILRRLVEFEKPINDSNPPVPIEFERRLAALERSIDQKNDRHLKTITIIFSCLAGLIAVCAILVTFLGWLSRTDATEAKKEMRIEMKDAISDMEKRFLALAGETLKKPVLQISNAKGPLDGQEFEIGPGEQFPLVPLFIKNAGDKKSDPLSARLEFSAQLLFHGPNWRSTQSNDKDFPFSFVINESAFPRNGLAAQESWAVQYLDGELFPMQTNRVLCKLLVFYGTEKPAEAKFVLRFRQ